MASKEEWIMSTENKSRFTGLQIRLLIALGSVVGLQTLSMTMLNSFVDLYGETLRWNTPLLCGLALGIYGLANAAFQIPYGSLSDRKGRRPVIMMGLLLLSAGLFIGFLAHDIYSLILSRAMQGCGAIQGIAYSWINDGVEDDKKSRAMSLAGIIVAIGGVGAFVGGPLLYNIMPVRYMFLICAALIFLTFLYILFFIKENRIAAASLPVSFGKQMKLLLKDKAVVFLSLCGFVNQYIFTVVFLVVPKEANTLIGAGRMWMIFLPAILIGILAMRITAAASDKGHYVLVAAGSFLLMFLGWFVPFPSANRGDHHRNHPQYDGIHVSDRGRSLTGKQAGKAGIARRGKRYPAGFHLSGAFLRADRCRVSDRDSSQQFCKHPVHAAGTFCGNLIGILRAALRAGSYGSYNEITAERGFGEITVFPLKGSQ